MPPNNSFPRPLEPSELLAFAGIDASPEGTFTRRFPGLPKQGKNNPLLEEGLAKLGEQLKAKKGEDEDEPSPEISRRPPAGYTYLGQFIDHDITFDLTALKDAQPDASKIPNFRAPFLDLDQVYGGGPNAAPFLYQNKPEYREAERFLIGQTNSPLKDGSSYNDLPRNPEGIALTGDPRQDENLIVGQLHVVFLKLHNWLLEHPAELAKSPHYENAGSAFATAQRITRWHYQWIVVRDFLKEILDPAVHASVLEAEGAPLPKPQGQFQIPVEFSVAAFRFGHSMVRNRYHINPQHMRVGLIRLIRLTSSRGLVGALALPRLPDDWKVDWQYFFETNTPDAVQPSGAIDTKIAPALYNVPMRDLKLFSAPGSIPAEEFRLPVRTLLRGARVDLPSGQAVADALGCEVLHGDRIVHGTTPEEAAVLKDYNFLEDTPLWYYLLKEAEVLGTEGRLGPACSRLIADVFIGAMQNTPDSYWVAGGTWAPTLNKGGLNRSPGAFNMADLILTVS